MNRSANNLINKRLKLDLVNKQLEELEKIIFSIFKVLSCQMLDCTETYCTFLNN